MQSYFQGCQKTVAGNQFLRVTYLNLNLDQKIFWTLQKYLLQIISNTLFPIQLRTCSKLSGAIVNISVVVKDLALKFIISGVKYCNHAFNFTKRQNFNIVKEQLFYSK